MKLFKLSTIAALLLTLMTGCTANTESPEALTMMPVYDETKSELYKNIDRLLVNSDLVLPANSKETGKINEVDLNSDGINEIVAFEKKKIISEEEQNEVGFLILQREFNSDGEEVYKNKGTIMLNGDTIDYANFYDLNDDGVKEIVISVKDSSKTNLHIFNFDEKGIEEIYKLEPSWIPGYSEYLNLKVKIGYIDEDPKLDMLFIHLDSSTNTAYVSICNYKNQLTLKDYVKIENVKDLVGLHVTLGNIATSMRGVILDIPTAKENNYITQILYLEEGKIKKAFKEDDKNMMKAYYIPIDDINKDKVLEIPIVNGNGHAYTSKSSANVSWYKWNGKGEEESSLVFNSQIYYNYSYNFKMFIPNSLRDKVTIQRSSNTENVSYNFNMYDSNLVDRKVLFTISVIPKVISDDSKTMSTKTGITVGETEEYSYVLNINDIEELKKLDVTTEALAEYFSFIY